MFDKAYLSIPADPQVGRNNKFSVDGKYPRAIFGGANLYKISAGKHEVEIISGTGEAWTVEANVGYNELLTVKVVLAGEDVCDVMYKVGPAAPGMGFAAMKLD